MGSYLVNLRIRNLACLLLMGGKGCYINCFVGSSLLWRKLKLVLIFRGLICDVFPAVGGTSFWGLRCAGLKETTSATLPVRMVNKLDSTCILRWVIFLQFEKLQIACFLKEVHKGKNVYVPSYEIVLKAYFQTVLGKPIWGSVFVVGHRA